MIKTSNAPSAARRPSRLPPLALMLFACACGTRLPEPDRAAHPRHAYAVVPHPPPPARAEVVPAQAHPDAVWIDGEWRWRGVRWVWIYGRWVLPPAGAAFAPWAWKRTRDGRLWLAPGTWRDARGRALAHPPALRLADAGEGDRMEDHGVLVDAGANDRARKRRKAPRESDCIIIETPLASQRR